MRILILGGTTEAFALADRLADQHDVVLSLAGRTTAPRASRAATRTGGFGGAEGLSQWLRDHSTDLVVDATHPFAAIISANAEQACRAANVPLLALRRPAWTRQAGDDWTEVADMREAVRALGAIPRRVFLTVGRLELRFFADAPWHHYLVRTIEPIGDALPVPHVTAVQAKGPFDEDAERMLMREHGIETLVTKNSGGAATYGKITAARFMRLPVIVVSPPAKPDVPHVVGVEDAVAWIERHGRASQERGV